MKSVNVLQYTFESIRENGLLLYEYVRGSTSQGLNLPISDIDKGGVFIMHPDDVNGLSCNRVEQISDEKGDVVWYELGRYLELLCKANPTMLESLFVDDEFVLYCHPLFEKIRRNRDMFVTKETFGSFLGYAKSQIYKARGLNKKIVKEVNERLTPIDFCNCLNDEQSSLPLKDWLTENGLKQQYCGINDIDKMPGVYGIYYDFGTHIRCEFPDLKSWSDHFSEAPDIFIDMLLVYCSTQLEWLNLPDLDERGYNRLLELVPPKGYHGIMKHDGSSNELRTDAIVKGDDRLNVLSYNRNAYEVHCREYKEYQEWVEHRNPQRYLENKDRNYDAKNLCHCMRLIHMGIEIATTGKVNVNRRNIDRDELLDIRLGKAEYDEIIVECENKEAELKEAIKNCTLPETVDKDKVNDVLIEIRKIFAS